MYTGTGSFTKELFLSVREGVVKCLKIAYYMLLTSNTLLVSELQPRIAVVVSV
jgi:hypothetical protein